MKVNGNKPPEHQNIGQGPQKIARQEGKEEIARKGKAQPMDRIDISQKAKEIMRLKAAINELPEVREDKVKALKDQIQAGTYSIDARKIAEKMLGE
jgi:negative regulator of flagellin synthesis FlgM